MRGEQSVYYDLYSQFGAGVDEIKNTFLRLDYKSRHELLRKYLKLYGLGAYEYADKTYEDWKSGRVELSGRTMERLMNLVPPYLSSEQRIRILKHVLLLHRKRPQKSWRVTIDATAPLEGIAELGRALESFVFDDELAYLPMSVMRAAKWLYSGVFLRRSATSNKACNWSA
jgi:hypothetical protein